MMIRILEETKDILSLVRNRFLETCWLLQSYRHSKACLVPASCLWTDIQDHPVGAFLLGHRRGMWISRICAWNTSRLACDGSGAFVRDPGNHSLCTFQNGKRYNCDLSASYNIGARYFIRELLKPLPVTERSLLEAKVPSVKRRISCVYADLRELFLEMELLRAA